MILKVDLNWTYLKTKNPLISTNQVQEFSLKPNQEVKIQQDQEQWDGIVIFDSKNGLWHIEIIQGTYRDLKIPEFPAFNNMNAKTARRHYSWFINEFMPKRLELFKNYFLVSTSGELILDYSPDSLIPLWCEFKSLSRTILNDRKHNDLIISELREIHEIRSASEWYKQAIGCEIQNLPPGYLELMLDISLYFSKVIIQTNVDVKWNVIDNFIGLKIKGKRILPLIHPKQSRTGKNKSINPFSLILLYLYYYENTKNMEESDEEDLFLISLYHLVLSGTNVHG